MTKGEPKSYIFVEVGFLMKSSGIFHASLKHIMGSMNSAGLKHRELSGQLRLQFLTTSHSIAKIR